MRCNIIKQRLGAFLLEELPERQADQVETHLAGCETCRHVYEGMRRARSVASQALGGLSEEGLGADRLEAVRRGESPERFRRGSRLSRSLRNWSYRLWPLSAILTPFLVIGLPFVFVFAPWAERVHDRQMPGEPLPGATAALFLCARFFRGPGVVIAIVAVGLCLAPWLCRRFLNASEVPGGDGVSDAGIGRLRWSTAWVHAIVAPVLLIFLCTALYLPRIRLIDKLGGGRATQLSVFDADGGETGAGIGRQSRREGAELGYAAADYDDEAAGPLTTADGRVTTGQTAERRRGRFAGAEWKNAEEARKAASVGDSANWGYRGLTRFDSVQGDYQVMNGQTTDAVSDPRFGTKKMTGGEPGGTAAVELRFHKADRLDRFAGERVDNGRGPRASHEDLKLEHSGQMMEEVKKKSEEPGKNVVDTPGPETDATDGDATTHGLADVGSELERTRRAHREAFGDRDEPAAAKRPSKPSRKTPPAPALRRLAQVAGGDQDASARMADDEHDRPPPPPPSRDPEDKLSSVLESGERQLARKQEPRENSLEAHLRQTTRTRTSRTQPDGGVETELEPEKTSIFEALPVNPFVLTENDPLSTFALDTDTASYTLTRGYLLSGRVPPPEAVRTEEFVNAFDYNYPSGGGRVFNVYAEAGDAPFGRGLTLLKVGIKARVIGRDGLGARHLVFALDTSGSMSSPDRLPLVQEALHGLVDGLRETDRVSLIGFGRQATMLLPPTSLNQDGRNRLAQTLDGIQCGGSTNIGNGVRAALDVAWRTRRAGEKTVVILCSDGMANLGDTEARDLLQLAAAAREHGVRLHTVGFGLGNYNDNVLEQLANRGDGSYLFVDSSTNARDLFVREMSARLHVVAADAKIQVAFNPASIRRYRLLGYENRDIADQDFRNDVVDAGEVGSGKSVTALYEVELTGLDNDAALGTVYVRYSNPESGKVEEVAADLERRILRNRTPGDSPRFFLAATVAEFAELLRQSEYAGDGSFADVMRVLAPLTEALSYDPAVDQLWDLVNRAEQLTRP